MGNNCKACGAELLWKKTMDGKNMPLNLKPVKMVQLIPDNSGETAIVIDAYTPHWATCPGAANFRKKKGE